MRDYRVWTNINYLVGYVGLPGLMNLNKLVRYDQKQAALVAVARRIVLRSNHDVRGTRPRATG